MKEVSETDEASDLEPRVAARLASTKVVFKYFKKQLVTAASKALVICRKYMAGNAGRLAEEMEMLDPRQRGRITKRAIIDYPLILPAKLHVPLSATASAGQRSEWDAYWECTVPAGDIDLCAWWSGMALAFSTLHSRATLPLTTTSVESTFSIYMLTRTEKQFAMHRDTHVARISHVFNGVVPSTGTQAQPL